VKVTVSDDEARTVRVAIRLAETAYTSMLSMSPSTEMRTMLMGALGQLHSVDKKFGA
jgi:hypothetical protein